VPHKDAERDAERLRALEADLAKASPGREAQQGSVGHVVHQANHAWRMVTELVAGLLIGFGIGWGLDALFGTRPIFLVVFVLVGLAAGVLTMMRTARELAQPAPPSTAPVADHDDDD